jgi:hypothetical protein
LTAARLAFGGCSSNTRGVFFGGRDSSIPQTYNIIDYITIASTGDATDFGDLPSLVYSNTATSSSTRGLSMGGYVGSAQSNVINYITLASTGDSTDFGDLATGASGAAATSNCHGGI